MHISDKELYYIKDHLSWELLMAKKYHNYAWQTADPQLQSLYEDLGKKHQRHYEMLLNQL